MNQIVSEALVQLKSAEKADMWEAAKVLVHEEDRSVVPKVLELMNTSPEPERRTAAAWTLGFLRSKAALDPLIRILENKSEPAALRDYAAEALGYLSDLKARKALIGNLTDENADVAFSCAFALRMVGELDDVPHLAKVAQTSTLTNSYGASVAQEAREAIEDIQARFQHDGSDQ